MSASHSGGPAPMPANQHPAATAAGLVRRWEDCLAPHELPRWAEEAALTLRALAPRHAAPTEEEGGNRAAERDALLQAALDFIGTLTGMVPPPIETAPPQTFAPFYAFVDRVQAITARPAARPCTCHPDDAPPVPCAKKYALQDCRAAAPGAAAAAPISRAEWRAAAKAFYLEAGDDEATATELARYLCDQQDWLGQEVGDPRVEAQEDIQGRPRPAPTHQPGLQAAAGVTPVLIDLLRDCLGPLEVSHAILESDDYGAMADLILRVKGALDQFDAARAAQAQGGAA